MRQKQNAANYAANRKKSHFPCKFQILFLSLSVGVANQDKHFKLANDIDLSTFSAETWGTPGWDPIGTDYLQRDNQNGVGRGRESDNITAIPTEAAMMKKSSFPGFFNSQTIWDIREGKSYPFLNGVGSYIPAGVELADTEQSAIWSADGILFVQATQPTVVQIYTLSGVLLKSAPVGIGTTTFSLPSGLCIVKTTNSSQMLLIR